MSGPFRDTRAGCRSARAKAHFFRDRTMTAAMKAKNERRPTTPDAAIKVPVESSRLDPLQIKKTETTSITAMKTRNCLGRSLTVGATNHKADRSRAAHRQLGVPVTDTRSGVRIAALGSTGWVSQSGPFTDTSMAAVLTACAGRPSRSCA